MPRRVFDLQVQAGAGGDHVGVDHQYVLAIGVDQQVLGAVVVEIRGYRTGDRGRRGHAAHAQQGAAEGRRGANAGRGVLPVLVAGLQFQSRTVGQVVLELEHIELAVAIPVGIEGDTAGQGAAGQGSGQGEVARAVAGVHAAGGARGTGLPQEQVEFAVTVEVGDVHALGAGRVTGGVTGRCVHVVEHVGDGFQSARRRARGQCRNQAIAAGQQHREVGHRTAEAAPELPQQVDPAVAVKVERPYVLVDVAVAGAPAQRVAGTPQVIAGEGAVLVVELVDPGVVGVLVAADEVDVAVVVQINTDLPAPRDQGAIAVVEQCVAGAVAVVDEVVVALGGIGLLGHHRQVAAAVDIQQLHAADLAQLPGARTFGVQQGAPEIIDVAAIAGELGVDAGGIEVVEQAVVIDVAHGHAHGTDVRGFAGDRGGAGGRRQYRQFIGAVVLDRHRAITVEYRRDHLIGAAGQGIGVGHLDVPGVVGRVDHHRPRGRAVGDAVEHHLQVHAAGERIGDGAADDRRAVEDALGVDPHRGTGTRGRQEQLVVAQQGGKVGDHAAEGQQDIGGAEGAAAGQVDRHITVAPIIADAQVIVQCLGGRIEHELAADGVLVDIGGAGVAGQQTTEVDHIGGGATDQIADHKTAGQVAAIAAGGIAAVEQVVDQGGMAAGAAEDEAVVAATALEQVIDQGRGAGGEGVVT